MRPDEARVRHVEVAALPTVKLRAEASVACIPKQLLPLLAVRPSSTQRLASTHISSAAIE